jgi:hypothetical protein
MPYLLCLRICGGIADSGLIFQEPGFWCTERRYPQELCTAQAGLIFNATTFIDDEQHASCSSGLPVIPR